MDQPESLLARISLNYRDNTKWLRDLWYNHGGERDKLLNYYRWHFKELALCVVLAILLTRVDKVQQFFSAFAIDIKAGEQEPLLFTFVFGMNGMVIFWLCYVFWHKPAKFRFKWRVWLFGDRRREDFEAYYRKPGSAWRVAMVASLPMLLVNVTLSLSILSDNPLENPTPSLVSRWLDENAPWVLLAAAVLYLLIGSLIRARSRIPMHHNHHHHHGQPVVELSVTEYDALLGKLWQAFKVNFALLPAMALGFASLLLHYKVYAAPFNFLLLVLFVLAPPLAVAFFLNSFSECLIIENQKEDACHLGNVKHQPKFEPIYDWLMRLSYFFSIVIFLLCNNKSITSQEWFSNWMFPVAMLMFVFIAYYQVLDLLVYNMTTLRFYTLFGILALSMLIFGQVEHYRLKYRGEVPRSGVLPRASLETYFMAWAKDRYETRLPGDTSTVFLVAAEGGGSRSGAWTSAVLTELNTVTKGRFQRRCFAISAVSGGSLGAAATLSLWDNAAKPGVPDTAMFVREKRDAYLGRIFRRNYISTALAGIFFYDGLQQIPGIHLLYRGHHSRTDRHQDEEDDAVCRALTDMFGNQAQIQHNYLKRTNFLALYYNNEWTDRRPRPITSLPLFFPNTCRVEDGRRGIVSPVLMDTTRTAANRKSPFNAAVVDIIGLFPDKDRSLSLGEATSLSELFPYVNSTVFINEHTGSFMDGGAYENLGLTTLYEIRSSLGSICQNLDTTLLAQAFPDTAQRRQFEKYVRETKFKMLLIYNSDNHGSENHAEYNNNSLRLLDPITALMQTPFGGHTDYMYHKTWAEFGRYGGVVDFPLLLPEDLKTTSEKIVMSRWLSKSEMNDVLARATVRVAAKIREIE